jgi:hypothetical protein
MTIQIPLPAIPVVVDRWLPLSATICALFGRRCLAVGWVRTRQSSPTHVARTEPAWGRLGFSHPAVVAFCAVVPGGQPVAEEWQRRQNGRFRRSVIPKPAVNEIRTATAATSVFRSLLKMYGQVSIHLLASILHGGSGTGKANLLCFDERLLLRYALPHQHW